MFTANCDAGQRPNTGKPSEFVNEFIGIPFAQPPCPKLYPPYDSSRGVSATAYSPAYRQQAIKFPIVSGLPAETLDYLTNTICSAVTPSAEDCPTLNVVAPAGVPLIPSYPLLRQWIYRGVFEAGGTSQYGDSIIVDKAISLGVPAI
ncbi:hypothetical protein BDN67DRAFT_982358 [Paxillus ammoniavirescens]|nr:hypothetical protein BDN67DRAFT_982358 [Paxillus ammoniavirescens]